MTLKKEQNIEMLRSVAQDLGPFLKEEAFTESIRFGLPPDPESQGRFHVIMGRIEAIAEIGRRQP